MVSVKFPIVLPHVAMAHYYMHDRARFNELFLGSQGGKGREGQGQQGGEGGKGKGPAAAGRGRSERARGGARWMGGWVGRGVGWVWVCEKGRG